ncbi:MAG: hypothetical protein IMX02_10075 [Limnochordaceae bacterium]|nr:hypothetical protein [Limnochordaceae bacterium]
MSVGRAALRWAWMVAGMTVITLGIRMQVLAELGLGPWDVLHMGLSLRTPLTFGQASQVVGAVLVVAALALGEVPRAGTLLNMWYVGALYDVVEAKGWFPPPVSVPMRWAYLVGGVLLLACGSAWYLSARLGSGPRDGMMLALARRLHRARSGRDEPAGSPGAARHAGVVRGLLEGAATLAGYVLGGPVGAGTIAAAALIGPSMAFFLPRFAFTGRWWPAPEARLRAPAVVAAGSQVPQESTRRAWEPSRR